MITSRLHKFVIAVVWVAYGIATTYLILYMISVVPETRTEPTIKVRELHNAATLKVSFNGSK